MTPPKDPDVRHAAPDRLVHPRYVWTGTALAIVGLVVTGVGLMAESVVTSVLGVVAMVIGAGIAWRAGIMRDTHTASSGVHEVSDVSQGRVHPGTIAGDMMHAPAAEEESRAADHRRRQLLERSHRSPAPPPARGAAALILLLAVVLLCAQWALYPVGRTAQDNALRASAITVILILCGLRIITADRPRRLAAGLVILAGLVLALFGPLAPHQETAVAWTETALGTLVVLAGVATLASGTGRTSDGRWRLADQ